MRQAFGRGIRRLKREVNSAVERYRFRQRQRMFHRWLNDFRETSATVLLGANFNRSGGVRHHIHAISRYSSQRVLLVPDDERLMRYGVALFNEFSEEFLCVAPSRTARVVHSHVLPWFVKYCRLHRSADRLWVHTHHALYHPEAEGGVLHPWQEELNAVVLSALRDCDIPLCVSRWQQCYLRQHFSIDSYYVPNGVDLESCDKAVGKKFRRKYSVEGPFVLWVGRNDPVKNPADFLSLALLFPAMQFVMICGMQPNEVESHYGIRVGRNVVLLPQMKHADVLDAIEACAVLVVTSLFEGLPTLVLEGMSLKKPLVVSRAAGCLDATDGDAHAETYAAGDQQGLAAALDRAMSRGDSLERSRARVLSEFDWRVVARRLDAIYSGESELVRRVR